MLIKLTRKAEFFISTLTSLQPSPNSIWLIGSRANRRATSTSDTDLIIFGSIHLLKSVRSKIKRPRNIDCLIIFNGNDYKDPWQRKSGSLKDLEWREEKNGSAKYKGIKFVQDEESSLEFGADMGYSIDRHENAIRLWPKIHSFKNFKNPSGRLDRAFKKINFIAQ